MIIAIEGLDGSGKTSVAQFLAQKHGFKYIRHPMQTFFGLPEHIYFDMSDKICSSEDKEAQALFFLLGNKLGTLCGPNVILDRNLLSTYFYDECEETKSLFSSFAHSQIKPDLTLLLYASPSKRTEHIRFRNPKDVDLFAKDKLTADYNTMISYAKRMDLPYVLVNTDKITTFEELLGCCDNLCLNFLQIAPEMRRRWCQIVCSYNKIKSSQKYTQKLKNFSMF